MRDVVIIGGGVVGLWCAWHLKREGRQVTVIDQSDLKDGCSFGNAGMIVPSHFIPLASPGMMAKGISWMFRKDSPFYIRPRLSMELAQWLFLFYRAATKKHVAESAALLRDMHEESREWYNRLNQSPGFNFGFEQKGILMLYKSVNAERDELKMAETAHHLGIEAIHLTPDQLKEIEPGQQMSVRGAIHYPDDAHLSPHIFMQQMMTSLRSFGVEFMTGAEVNGMLDDGAAGCIVQVLNREKLFCKNIVLASGSWSGKLMKQSGFRLPMVDGKGYSMTVHHPVLKPTIPSILHEARVAITPMGDDLRISGTLEISGMDGRINMQKVNAILKAVPDYYPQMNIRTAGQVWHGYRPCSPDGIPYIGRLKPAGNIVLAAGHAMMGLSLAPATGRIVTEILKTDRKNLSHKLDASRF